MRSRLYLQIYATVFGCLAAIAIAIVIAFFAFGEERVPPRWAKVARTLVERVVPPDTAPASEIQSIIESLGNELETDLTLYAADGSVQAQLGKQLKLPRGFPKHRKLRGAGWRKYLFMRLDDGRLLVAKPQFELPDDGIAKLFGTIILALLAVMLAAYPLVRRLTRRLETFHATVERAGTGDLSARVHIKGKDEIAQLASAYNASADRVERLVKSNKMLLANASHELRTPLSRIRLGVEMVRDGGAPARLDALQADIAELDELIDEILLMSRLEETSDRLTFEPVDLLALTAEECARFDTCSLSGAPVELNADPRLIRRMLRNLIVNAHRHGKPPVETTLTNDGDNATLTVIDHGDGVPEQSRPHIFEPFFRGQGKQNVAGYGLGLALVHQIVKGHGGSIKLNTASSGGAEFVVTLPINPSEQLSGGRKS